MKRIKEMLISMRIRWKTFKEMPKIYSNIKMLLLASDAHIIFLLHSRIEDKIDRVKADLFYISLIDRIKKDSIDLYKCISNVRYHGEFLFVPADIYLSNDGIVSRIKALNMMMLNLYERDDVSVRGMMDVLDAPGPSIDSRIKAMVSAIPVLSMDFDKWVKEESRTHFIVPFMG